MLSLKKDSTSHQSEIISAFQNQDQPEPQPDLGELEMDIHILSENQLHIMQLLVEQQKMVDELVNYSRVLQDLKETVTNLNTEDDDQKSGKSSETNDELLLMSRLSCGSGLSDSASHSDYAIGNSLFNVSSQSHIIPFMEQPLVLPMYGNSSAIQSLQPDVQLSKSEEESLGEYQNSIPVLDDTDTEPSSDSPEQEFTDNGLELESLLLVLDEKVNRFGKEQEMSCGMPSDLFESVVDESSAENFQNISPSLDEQVKHENSQEVPDIYEADKSLPITDKATPTWNCAQCVMSNNASERFCRGCSAKRNDDDDSFSTQNELAKDLPFNLFLTDCSNLTFEGLSTDDYSGFHFDSDFQGFQDAGQPVFSSFQSGNSNNNVDDNRNESISSTPCKTEIQNHQWIETKSGEEDELVLFKETAKLFRYSTETKLWNERGTGEIKLLRDPGTNVSRILMRRYHVFSICANHRIQADMQLKKWNKSSRVWVWVAQDYSDETCREEVFAVKFQNEKLFQKFKIVFDECALIASTVRSVFPSPHEAAESTSSTLNCLKDKNVFCDCPRCVSSSGKTSPSNDNSSCTDQLVPQLGEQGRDVWQIVSRRRMSCNSSSASVMDTVSDVEMVEVIFPFPEVKIWPAKLDIVSFTTQACKRS